MLLWESGDRLATIELLAVLVGPSVSEPFRRVNPKPLLLHAGADKGFF